MCGSGSVFIIRIRIHTASEYGSWSITLSSTIQYFSNDTRFFHVSLYILSINVYFYSLRIASVTVFNIQTWVTVCFDHLFFLDFPPPTFHNALFQPAERSTAPPLQLQPERSQRGKLSGMMFKHMYNLFKKTNLF